MPDFPPAPWAMRGPCAVVAAPMPLETARALVGASGARVVPIAPGRALGMVLLGDYRDGSTLRYGELAGLVAPILARGRVCGWVDSMWVDDPRSRAGGRELWNVPKDLARFDWRDEPGGRTSVEVFDEAGELLAGVAWTRPKRRLPVPAAGHFAGGIDGTARVAALGGSGRIAPRDVRLHIPAGSPLARLQLGSPRLAVAGRADVRAFSPR